MYCVIVRCFFRYEIQTRNVPVDKWRGYGGEEESKKLITQQSLFYVYIKNKHGR